MAIPTVSCCGRSLLRWGAAAGLTCLCFLLTDYARASTQLRDVTKQTGISFVHTDGNSGKRYIVETVSAGLALFDHDGDRDIDIYFLNGAPLRGTVVDVPPKNALYRNDGGWNFTDVTDQAGVGDTGYGLGVAVGDYDNDGDPDLYLNNYGPNVLYRNNGDGTFTDVTEKAGVANGRQVGAGACFLDIDKDGDLDLYVANYVDFTYENHQIVRFNGYPAYVGPMKYQPTPDTLYRNNGDGSFEDVTRITGAGDGTLPYVTWGNGRSISTTTETVTSSLPAATCTTMSSFLITSHPTTPETFFLRTSATKNSLTSPTNAATDWP